MGCVFCDLGMHDVQYSNATFVARLDIHPVSPGHMLLIPKRHVERQSELVANELLDLEEARRAAECYVERMGPEVLRRRYERIRDAARSENSPWFVTQALAHTRFGEKPDGFNFFVNQGEAAGQTVTHLHCHVVPRYHGDVHDPFGGARSVIPELANYTRQRRKTPRVESMLEL